MHFPKLLEKNADKIQHVSDRFLNYINKTGAPFLSVKEIISKVLLPHNFQQIEPEDLCQEKLSLSPENRKFFVHYNYSTIVAFILPRGTLQNFRLVGSHTDSPCLKLRPNPGLRKDGYIQLNVSTYGGGLWNTWFDRGLGVAGKVVTTIHSKIQNHYVLIKEPVATIPSLAIHLYSNDECVNQLKLNKEHHLQPIIASQVYLNAQNENASNQYSFSSLILDILSKEIGCKSTDITDVDLCLLDSADANRVGAFGEFLMSGRLDNLVGTWCGFEALADTHGMENTCCMMVAFDHEEVGSNSFTGAKSSILKSLLSQIEKLYQPHQKICTLQSRSNIVLSVDMAHATHPNYPDRCQPDFKLAMHGGVVIKTNENQSYTTEATGRSFVREIARLANVPCQDFIVGNQQRCGSTIGPIMASGCGFRCVDIGIPQWAMHSCRETCSSSDLYFLTQFLKEFYSNEDVRIET